MWINTWRVERRTRVNSHLNRLINNFHLNRVQIGRFSQKMNDFATSCQPSPRKLHLGSTNLRLDQSCDNDNKEKYNLNTFNYRITFL